MTVWSQPDDGLNIRILPDLSGIGGLMQKAEFAPAVFNICSAIGG